MSMKNFRVEDMPVKIAHAKDSKPGATKTAAKTASAPTTMSASEPPDGTSKEVLDWVGDDQARAQAALDKEQANEKPRVGLSEDLEKIPADDEDAVEDEDAK